MPFKKIFAYLPKRETLLSHEQLPWIGKHLQHPNLWHFNRSSVARGAGIGMLVAFIPLPFQMVIAALFAVLFPCNIPIAIACTWITNPVTFVPINYLIYKVGKWVTQDTAVYSLTHSYEWQEHTWKEITIYYAQWLKTVGKPFVIGLPIVAVCSAIISYVLVHLVWKIVIYLKWQRRKSKSAL